MPLPGDPAFPIYLTFPNTVLSPTFMCVINSNTTLMGNLNLTYVSTIDTQIIQDQVTLEYRYDDVCLGWFYRLPGSDFVSWRCINYERNLRLAFPVRSNTSTDPANVVQAAFSSCDGDGVEEGTIYSFLNRPIPVYVPPTVMPSDWIRDNIIYILLGIVGVLSIIAGVFYLSSRLYRYRDKYIEERKKVDEMNEEVEEMQQFGGKAGMKDTEVEMTDNPLVLQMKDMQAKLDKKTIEMEQEEIKEQEDASEARQEHISNLKQDRNELQSELEKLRQMLAESAQAGGRQIKDEDAEDAAGTGEGERAEFEERSTKKKKKKQFD